MGSFDVTKEKPIFICGNIKSGTTLLQSLLDSHSCLFVLPVELKFFTFANVPSLPPGNMPPRKGKSEFNIPYPWGGKTSYSEILAQIRAHKDFRRLLEDSKISRDIEIPSDVLDREKLSAELDALSPSSLKEFYLGLVLALTRAVDLPGLKGTLRFVEKTPHMEEYASELANWFPDAKFLHVLRNPYANVHSIRKTDRFVSGLRNEVYRPTAKSYYYMEKNNNNIRNYKIIKYEDIVLETGDTLNEIAEFLDIEYEHTLEQPTFLGKEWGGNSRTQSSSFSGIDPRPVSAFRGSIHAFDKAVVNRFFSPVLDKYNYEKLPTSHWRKWLPAGLELPLSYFCNRYLLYDEML